MDKLEPHAIKLVQISPRNFDSGLSSNEKVMISMFSVFGSLILACFIIISLFYHRCSVLEFVAFVVTVASYIGLCLSIYYCVRGDLDWAAGGSIIGITD